MTNCRSVVVHYANMNVLRLSDLWTNFDRRGPAIDTLRELLLYYIHHENFPPLMQKSCDTLLSSVDLKNVPRKLKNIIFQIMEEVGTCLENSIVEQVSLASHKNNHSALFNCILVSGLIPLLDELIIEKLLSFLKNSDVTVEERGKLLLCLLVIHETCPNLISSDSLSRLELLMESWFRHVPKKIIVSNALFGRSDSSAATEVDGSCAGEMFTILTLANNFNDHHMMSIHCFSTIREWFGRRKVHQNRKLIESLREYCSMVIEQCFRSAHKEHDIALQKAAICEVLDIMNQLVQLDSSHGPLCLLVVKRIQNNFKEHFRGDYRDVCVFVRVLSFLLNFGKSTGYNSLLVCEQFLQDTISRSYTSGLAAIDIIGFLVENKQKIIALQQPLLQRFFPNILKIVSCHPCVVVEEFVELLTDIISPESSVEVFHRLVDLPLLSATLCLHQAPVLALADSAGSLDAEWATLLSRAQSEKNQHTFNYFMRVESGQKICLEKVGEYINLLHKISNHSLVITCSQIVPLLLETYFSAVGKWKDVAYVAPIVQCMFTRLSVLYTTPGYTTSIHKCLFLHFKQIFKVYPGLIFSVSSNIIEYISSRKNYDIFPQLYIHIVYVMGESSCIGEWISESLLQISQFYESVECLIYEILAQNATSESVCLELLNIASSALAKLASRCQDQIPRTMLCLNKVRVQFLFGSSSHRGEEHLVRDRIEELLCVLQHSNTANVIWSSQPCSTSVTSFVRVLSHITDT